MQHVVSCVAHRHETYLLTHYRCLPAVLDAKTLPDIFNGFLGPDPKQGGQQQEPECLVNGWCFLSLQQVCCRLL